MKTLLRHPVTQAALAHLLGAYFRFALATTRWTIETAEGAAPHFAGEPAILAFWHQRLPLLPKLWQIASRRAGRPMHAHVLVSRHRDGRFIATVIGWFRIATVHGSSSRGGAAALREMLRLLSEGMYVAITPDGPRGPARIAAPGVAQLAALSGHVILPCAAQTSRRRVLRSWDRMIVPLPFGRGVFVLGAPIAVPREGWEAALPTIQDALNAAADRADRLCPA